MISHWWTNAAGVAALCLPLVFISVRREVWHRRFGHAADRSPLSTRRALDPGRCFFHGSDDDHAWRIPFKNADPDAENFYRHGSLSSCRLRAPVTCWTGRWINHREAGSLFRLLLFELARHCVPVDIISCYLSSPDVAIWQIPWRYVWQVRHERR